MYVAAQLSLWMGFEEIYILGVDLGYGTDKYMIVNNNINPADYAHFISYFAHSWKTGKFLSSIINGLAFKPSRS
jgi:hypothetical protein